VSKGKQVKCPECGCSFCPQANKSKKKSDYFNEYDEQMEIERLLGERGVELGIPKTKHRKEAKNE
jgi:hypothetical protein